MDSLYLLMWQVRFIEINFFAIKTGSSFPIEHWLMMYSDTFTDQRTKLVSVVEGKAPLKKKTFWSNKPFVADIFYRFLPPAKKDISRKKTNPAQKSAWVF